jgi:hypothetical protein
MMPLNPEAQAILDSAPTTSIEIPSGDAHFYVRVHKGGMIVFTGPDGKGHVLSHIIAEADDIMKLTWGGIGRVFLEIARNLDGKLTKIYVLQIPTDWLYGWPPGYCEDCG